MVTILKFEYLAGLIANHVMVVVQSLVQKLKHVLPVMVRVRLGLLRDFSQCNKLALDAVVQEVIYLSRVKNATVLVRQSRKRP